MRAGRIVFWVVVALIIICCVCCVCCHRRRQTQQTPHNLPDASGRFCCVLPGLLSPRQQTQQTQQGACSGISGASLAEAPQGEKNKIIVSKVSE